MISLLDLTYFNVGFSYFLGSKGSWLTLVYVVVVLSFSCEYFLLSSGFSMIWVLLEFCEVGVLLVDELTIVVLLFPEGRYLAEELPDPREEESTFDFVVDMP